MLLFSSHGRKNGDENESDSENESVDQNVRNECLKVEMGFEGRSFGTEKTGSWRGTELNLLAEEQVAISLIFSCTDHTRNLPY